MAWATPKTWVAAEVLTAADINAYVSDLLVVLGSCEAAGEELGADGPITDLARIATGTYTGNASDDRSITGIGFTPKFVQIKASAITEVARYGVTGDNSWYMDTSTSFAANFIQAFNSDGFQLGSNAGVNNNGTTYYYLAIG